jgi:tetratricopeptide (TPR) repeat protein
MDFAAQLRVLQAAQGDQAKLALVPVDLAFHHLTDDERSTLKRTLEAAAIPHWFDPAILATLLEIPSAEGARRLDQIRRLTVVESFPARGENAFNVLEAPRLAVRKRLAAEDRGWFQDVSERAANYFASDQSAIGKTEWIYHRFCSDPEKAVADLERLNEEWIAEAHPEDRQALVFVLRELDETGLVHGRAQVWVLLAAAWNRAERGESARLRSTATRILELARSVKDRRAEADAQCLTGDVLAEQGKIRGAKRSYTEYLSISKELADQNPENAEGQRDLAVAYSRVGDALKALGKLEEARQSFKECLAITERLAKENNQNVGRRWRRLVAVAHGRMGDVLEAQGKLEEARADYAESLEILKRLAQEDPTNSDFQRELAVGHGKIGRVFKAQGNLHEAQLAFDQNLRIIKRLADQDPTDAGWQWDLAAAYSRVGDVMKEQRKLAEAEAAFEKFLAITQQLTDLDPSNGEWQRGLAFSHFRLARLHGEELSNSIHHLRAAVQILQKLVAGAPDHSVWRKELDDMTKLLSAAEESVRSA